MSASGAKWARSRHVSLTGSSSQTTTPVREDPTLIRRAILDACPGAVEIGDRGRAIRTAIEGLGAGDGLLIAGKGHEREQTVGDRVIAFDDADVARSAMTVIAGGWAA